MKNQSPVVVDGLMIIIYSDTSLYYRMWDDLRLISSRGHDCEFYFNNKERIVSRITFKELSKILPQSSFCYVHRCFIIHYKLIFESHFEKDSIIFNREKISLSRFTIEEIIQRAKIYNDLIRPEYLKLEALAKEIFLKNNL